MLNKVQPLRNVCGGTPYGGRSAAGPLTGGGRIPHLIHRSRETMIFWQPRSRKIPGNPEIQPLPYFLWKCGSTWLPISSMHLSTFQISIPGQPARKMK